MAKTQPKQAAALVLVDNHAHGLKAGQILEASAELIASLGSDVDPHPDAVAYARSQGAEVVGWPEPAAEA